MVDAIPVSDEYKAIKEVIVTFVDITERKKAEEERDEAYSILNKSPIVAFVWENSEGWPVKFVSVNIKTVFGYDPDELISGGLMYSQIVHPDDLGRVGQQVDTFSNLKNCQEFVHEPYRILTKKGEICWVDDRTFIKKDQAGEITHYQGIIIDITDRYMAEKALRDSENRLSVIFNNTSDLQLLVNVESDSTYRIEAVNKQYLLLARKFGFDVSQSEIIGKTVSQVANDVFGFDKTIVDRTLKKYNQVVKSGFAGTFRRTLQFTVRSILL